MPKPALPARPKASQSPHAVEERRKLFVERYLVNGGNSTDAAKHAGFSPATAGQKGAQIYAEPWVQEQIRLRTQVVIAKAELTTERWAKEMAAIAHFDPGELYDETGQLIPLWELPEHVRRAISAIDVERRREGRGDDAQVVETTKIKTHDKNTALANVGKHLGVFAEDNHQRTTAIQVNIQLLG